MSDKPDFGAQFRDPPKPKAEFVYMGGTTIGCGDHPSTAHLKHRWSKVRTIKKAFGQYRSRMCLRCGLTEDASTQPPPGKV